MPFTRRKFLATSTALTAGALAPAKARAASHGDHSFNTASGTLTVHPIAHASVVLETDHGIFYVDPVGDPDRYSDFPDPDMILVTHEHGDHFKADTLTALAVEKTILVTNPAVYSKLPNDLVKQSFAMANGDDEQLFDLKISAIPAHNLTPDRMKFHPKGRDNGYVLTIDGFRVYISGDTEDIPEMLALTDIDLAFVCMNLPFTMDAATAAAAVNAFKPKVCYPYHYRGRDDGTQDPKKFADLIEGVNVKFGEWYG